MSVRVDMAQNYSELKARHLENGTLFEDPEFPASERSIYFSKPVSKHVQWKRAPAICDDPQFIIGGATRYDLTQGALGNCWFVAAAATLASKQQLLKRVVPLEQSFQQDYAGIFRFHFWRYGEWQEVVVDDKLPVKYGRFLLFCGNKADPNEFWCALLEKAYAKLHGSYEALTGGKIQDALVDFTGGAAETVNLRLAGTKKMHLFRHMNKLDKLQTLMGCSIATPGSSGETKLSNGLYGGHAYSITGLAKFQLEKQTVRLVRLRNPWGKHQLPGVSTEWTGRWSDGSSEWDDVPEAIKNRYDLRVEEDGEFWMSFDDWKRNFTELQMCHMEPGEMSAVKKSQQPWLVQGCRGCWVRGVSAGGCGGPPEADMYWTNPQYRVVLEKPDDVTTGGKDQAAADCTVIISLMQKDRRRLRSVVHHHGTSLDIAYDVYRLRERFDEPLDADNYQERAEVVARLTEAYSSSYREYCQRHLLTPGNYCVVPATRDANKEAEFYLRVFTVKQASLSELDIPSGPVPAGRPLDAIDSSMPEISPLSEEDMLEMVNTVTDSEDASITWIGLHQLLPTMYCEGYQVDAAGCRALVSVTATAESGRVSLVELQGLKCRLDQWQAAFSKADKLQANSVPFTTLKHICEQSEVHLSPALWKLLGDKYVGDEHQFSFNDFVAIATRMIALRDSFASLSSGRTEGSIEVTLEQWLSKGLML